MTQQQDGLSAMIAMLNAEEYLVSLTQDALDKAHCTLYLLDGGFVTSASGRTLLEALRRAALEVLE